MSDWVTADSKPKGQRPQGQKSTSKPKGQGKGYAGQAATGTATAPATISATINTVNQPGQKMGFANMMAKANPKQATVQKEVNIEDVIVARDMTRSYELTRPPPEGFQAVLKKTFPSMDVCVINYVEIKGKSLPSLFVHFCEDHNKAYDDYDRAATINVSVQGIGIRLTAVSTDKTDGDGMFIPKISKTIQASGMPFSLARNPDAIRAGLEEFVEFDSSDNIKMVYEDGMFKGSVIIPVAHYKRVPPTHVMFPFFIMNSYGNYEKVPNATCKVKLVWKGYEYATAKS